MDWVFSKGQYFLVSVHREENVDNRKNLLTILTALEVLHNEFDPQVIVSTYPRTRKRLELLGRKDISDGIKFPKPFGFFDYVHFQMNACSVENLMQHA